MTSAEQYQLSNKWQGLNFVSLFWESMMPIIWFSSPTSLGLDLMKPHKFHMNFKNSIMKSGRDETDVKMTEQDLKQTNVHECETPWRRVALRDDTVRKQQILNTYHGCVKIGIPGKLIPERIRWEDEFGRNAGTSSSRIQTDDRVWSHNPVCREEKLVRLQKTSSKSCLLEYSFQPPKFGLSVAGDNKYSRIFSKRPIVVDLSVVQVWSCQCHVVCSNIATHFNFLVLESCKPLNCKFEG